MYCTIFILTLFLSSPFSWALEEPQEETPPEPIVINKWTFNGEYDNFKIEKKNGKYVVGKREVNPDVFQEFEQIFNVDTNYDVGCPHDLGNKPTIRITAHSEKKSFVREFFVEKGYVRDKKNNKCLFIMKEGLTRLPLHRDWFVGQTNATISIKNKLQFYSDGKILFDFEKSGNQWQQKLEGKFINWEFFEQVLDSFVDYPLDKRYHTGIAKEKKSFEIRTGREVYTFYLVGRNFWAVKLPKVKWLIGSSAWALFENFNPELLLSRYHSQLIIVTDKNLENSERYRALTRLGVSWTPSIKQAFHKIMLDPDDDVGMKTRILAYMKRKPTNENMKVLVKSLEQTEDLQLQADVTKVLRIMNPRGPMIKLEEPEKNHEYIRQWKKWADSLK